MSVQPETLLVRKIKAAILERYPDAVVYKIHGGPNQEAGIPDLICCVAGRFVGLEVKKQGIGESTGHAYARTTAIQLYQRDRIIAAGGLAATVLSVSEALDIVETALALQPE